MRSVPRPVIRTAVGAVLAFAVVGCSTTAPPPQSSSEPEAGVQAETIRTVWQDTDRGWVRLVAAEPGAGGYDHPIRVDPKWLRQTLYDIKLRDRDVDENAPDVRLFEVEQLDTLVPAIAGALADAKPGQAVAFASAARRGGFTFFDPVRLTTGRVFVADAKLNILFGPVAEPLPEDAVRRNIENARAGTRETVLNQGDTVWSRSWASSMRREDWIALPVQTTQGALPPVPASDVAQPAGRGEPAASGQPATSGQAADSGQAVDASRPAARGDVRERLEELKGLYEDGLITEDEYRRERQEVLEAF